MAYPVSVSVEPQTTGRNRLSVGFRPFLAIPHAILVGPIFWAARGGGPGLVGATAYVMAVMSWFTLVLNGQHVRGMRDFALFYLRWRVRALSYMALFSDIYPPFGEGTYPASVEIVEPAQPRDRTSIAIRLLLAIPHVVLLVFLMVGWFVTTVVAWIVIVVTGEFPAAVLPFGIGVMRWLIRVEAYLLLLTDEYPPFALE